MDADRQPVPPPEDRTPAEPADASAGESCARARRRIADFLAGVSAVPDDRALHDHLRECADCRADYRDAALMASRLGRGGREERRQLDRERRRRELRETLTLGEFARRTRFAHLRLLLLPAFFGFMMVTVVPLITRPVGAQVRVTEGGAFVGERPLHPGSVPLGVGRGDWCRTDAGSSAEVKLIGARLELGASTQLLVEDTGHRKPGAGRCRLDRGQLRVSGTCLVTTPWGVIEVSEGEALLVAADRLRVDAIAGSVAATNAEASLPVGPGEHAELGPR